MGQRLAKIVAIALLPTLSGACATARGPRPLTAQALERAGIACGAPDAELRADEDHLSIVLDGASPDRRAQVRCLFDWVSGHGYWIDQIVTQRANDAAP